MKAECDVCCTSANAVDVVRKLHAPTVIMPPDAHLAQYVAAQTGVNVIAWNGECEVHVRFTGDEIADYRQRTGAYVLAHPESTRDVQQRADFVGSTAAMITHLMERQPASALLVTECSMADNIVEALPQVKFVRPCNLCSHMKRITLRGILEALQAMSPQIEVDPLIASRARATVQRMLQ